MANDVDIEDCIDDSVQAVIDAAWTNRIIRISHSFTGCPNKSAIVICFVTCPNELEVELQEAIDRAIEAVLRDFPEEKPIVH